MTTDESQIKEKSSIDLDNAVLPDYDEVFTSTEPGKNLAGKVLFRFFRENYREFILSLIFFFIKNAAVWIIPIIMANALEIAANPSEHNLSELWMNALIGFLSLVQNIPFSALYIRYSSRALRNIGAGLRNSLIKKLQHLSITYHKEVESGRLQSKFLRDIEAIEFLTSQMVMSIIPAIINIIVTVVITMQKSLTVTMFYIVIIPTSLSLIMAFRKPMRNSNSEFRHEVENMSAKISDMLEMIPITKAHGLEDEEIDKLEKNIKRLKSRGMKLDKTAGFFGAFNWVAVNVLSNSCIIFTAFLAYKGKIQVGDIIMYQTYFGVIMGQANMLIGLYPEFIKGTESLKSVSEIMLSNDIEDNRDKIRIRYVHGTIQFKDVYYKYPNADNYSIKNFSINVEPGECVAFVGASGSGKSTIMNMIIGFMKPNRGVVKIDGKDIFELDLRDYRKFIAVVPQNSILFTGTIRDNITYGMKSVDEARLNEVVELANIKEFIDKMPDGLDTKIGEHGGKLSGGQKQRIAIARALIRDPKIIILDEATSALDNISEYQVQQAMGSLIKGRTTFIVAHRLSTIRDADRIVVMENGEIVEIGTFDELMSKKGEFYKLKTLSEINTAE